MATSKDYSDDEDDNWLKDVQDADVFVMYNNDDEYEIFKYIFSIFEENNVFTLICPNEEHHSCTFAIQMLQRFLKNVFHISANEIYYGPWY
jgi:hypothetical protein